MRTLLVMRQLTGVMDAMSARITRRFGLTVHDVLGLGWIAERPGISGSRIAEYIGRTRQSVQRSLERLEFRELVERHESCIRDLTSGWGMTVRGQELWEELARAYSVLEKRLEGKGAAVSKFIDGLEELLRELRQASHRSTWNQLIEIPREDEAPESDL